MSRPINLCIVINDKILTIPFNSLEEVDIFTMRYENRYNFLNRMIKILDLNVLIKDITEVYIEPSINKNMPIKYSRDNYNLDSLIDCYALCVIKDKRYISSGLKKVIINIKGDCSIDNLTLKDIAFIIKRYFDRRYSIHREIYFMIKDDVDIKIDKISSENINLKRDNISELESDNDYIQYLIELKQRGYDDLALDELSKVDLEVLSTNLKNSRYGIFDGICNNDLSIYEDIIILEESTGLTIDSIKELCYKKINSGYKR